MSRARDTRGVQRQRLLTGAQEPPRSGEPRAARELRVVRGQLRRLAAAIESDEWHEVALLASVVSDHLRDGGDVDGAESELEMVLAELAAFASEDVRTAEPEDEPAAVVVVDDLDEPTDEGEAFEREPIEDDDDDDDPGDVADRRQTFLRWSGR